MTSFITHISNIGHSQEIALPQALSGAERAKLQNSWEYFSHSLTHHDGSAREWMKIGVKIQDNPLLRAVIEDTKDKLLDLVHQCKQLDDQRTLLGRQKNRELDAMKASAQLKMVILNNKALERLQQQDFGFSPEQKAAILKDAPSPSAAWGTPLREDDAFCILSKIIGRTVDSYVSNHPLKDRVGIVPPTLNVESRITWAEEMKKRAEKGMNGRTLHL